MTHCSMEPLGNALKVHFDDGSLDYFSNESIKYVYDNAASVHSYSAESGIFPDNLANSMAANALAPCIARASAISRAIHLKKKRN